MSKQYQLEIKIHSAYSKHMKWLANNNCSIDIDSIDGKQRVSYNADSSRILNDPNDNQISIVTFPDSHTFLLSSTALEINNNQHDDDDDDDNDIKNDNNEREFLEITFKNDENLETNTTAVLGRLELPLSNLLKSSSSSSSSLIENEIIENEIYFSNMSEDYELYLRIIGMNDLVSMNNDILNNDHYADPHFTVYFADNDGKIIPLPTTTTNNNNYVSGSNISSASSGVVDVATASVNAVTNAANNLVYISTAGLAGKANKPEKPQKPLNKPEKPQKPTTNNQIISSSTSNNDNNNNNNNNNNSCSSSNSISSSKPTIPPKPTTVSGVAEMAMQKTGKILTQGAGNLLHISTGGMLGSKSSSINNSSSSNHNNSSSNYTGGAVVSGTKNSNDNNNDKNDNINKKSSHVNVVQNAGNVAVGAATGLMNLGTATIVGTANLTGNVIQSSISTSTSVLQSTSNVTVNVLTLGNTSIISNKNKNDIIYQSSVINNTLHPIFNDMIKINTKKYLKQLKIAKFLLLQIWDKNTLADVCLGEIYIPIISAELMNSDFDYDNNNDDIKKVKIHTLPIQLSNYMKLNKTYNYLTKKLLHKNLGTISYQFMRKDLVLNYNDEDPITVKLLMQLKPINAIDYAWPCRLLPPTSNNNSTTTSSISSLSLSSSVALSSLSSTTTATAVAATSILTGQNVNNNNNSNLHSSSSVTIIDEPENEIFYVQLRHDGLLVTRSVSSTSLISSSFSDRTKLLFECRERMSPSTSSSSSTTNLLSKNKENKNILKLLIPYNQISLHDIYILSTSTIICSIILNRKFKDIDRPFLLDLLISPCPSYNFYTILHQRIHLYSYHDAIKNLSKFTATTLHDYNAISKDLEDEIFSTCNNIQKYSQTIVDTTTLITTLTNKFNIKSENDYDNNNNNNTTSFLSKNHHITMSLIYFHTILPIRVLFVRKICLKIYLWMLLEFSNTTIAKSYFSSSSLTKCDIDDNYIYNLTNQANLLLKYGKTKKEDDDDDNNDNVDDNQKVIDTNSLVTRLQDILTSLDFNLRLLFIQSYHNNISSSYIEYLATQLIYQQYLLVVSYLASLLIDDDNNNHDQYSDNSHDCLSSSSSSSSSSVLPSSSMTKYPPIPPPLNISSSNSTTNFNDNNDNNILKKSLNTMSLLPGVRQTANLFNDSVHLVTSGTLKSSSTATVIDKNYQQQQQYQHKEIDSQLKHELISFVISHDNIFEHYLQSNLYSYDYKFSVRPVLSMCLDFDLLIIKFANLLNDNIKLWNSKAIQSIMCRKINNNNNDDDNNINDHNNNNTILPWDITIFVDNITNIEFYTSHIPESIQIQLNIQISMKKIQSSVMGDNLSILSIRRIYEINLKIAKSIAKAYLSLAVEYENYLTVTIDKYHNNSSNVNDDLINKEKVTKYAKVLGKAMLDVSTLGATYVLDINIDGSSNVNNDYDSSSSSDQYQHHDHHHHTNKNEEDHSNDDEILCFLMSVINDCRRINNKHIPESIQSFVKEFSDNNNSNDNQEQALSSSPIKIINDYFSNPLKAIYSVSQIAINYISNQVLFDGELREYMLHDIADHLMIKKGKLTYYTTLFLYWDDFFQYYFYHDYHHYYSHHHLIHHHYCHHYHYYTHDIKLFHLFFLRWFIESYCI